MRALILLFAFIYWSQQLHAAEVKGALVHESSKPVSHQPLFLNNGIQTNTDDSGRFAFTGLMSGDYELKVEIGGQIITLHYFTIADLQQVLQMGTITFTRNIVLQTAEVRDLSIQKNIERMPDVKDNVIYAAKKTEVVRLSTSSANLAQNNSRQIFAKVPGVQVWENDGSGVQMGIATRGLSPNRMWEFNTRQNGYDISADPFGYPEAYYTPSVESVERIEVIRGAASIQYGAQFGGVVNYIKKRSVNGKPIGVESMQTWGSYGMFSSFNAVGGNIKNFSYYANINYRRADGWRENSGYQTWNGYVNLGYKINKKLAVNFEYTRMDALMQQAGGLTDSMFKANHQQSVRNRNWFNVVWNIAALNLDYRINANHSLNVKAFALTGKRYSIGNMAAIQVPETRDSLGRWSPRTVDKDDYENYGVEFRHLFTYQAMGQKQTLSAGVRFYRGNTYRIQNRNGNRDETFNLEVSNNQLSRDIHYTTDNAAVFAEQLWNINNRLSVTLGARYEYLYNTAKGITDDTKIINRNSTRNFFIAGVGLQYKTTASTTLYANFTQAYRPVLFSDITVATTDSIDANLKDATGYNIDIGYRGNFKKFVSFDVSAFYLYYGNRIGTYTVNGKNFRTNIGASVSKGVEAYLECSPTEALGYDKLGHLSVFASLSFIDATYTQWNDPDATKNQTNKRVENAPQYIHRFGLSYRYKMVSTSIQQSRVGAAYADALNTQKPNAAATVGEIPAYAVTDWSLSIQFKKGFQLNGGINNVFDEAYFTRRAGGYPGPGLLPADGRLWYVGAGLKF